MVSGIKDKAAEAGHTIAETAKTVGHKIAEGAEKATDWVKEKAHIGANKGACDTSKMACASDKTANIREHMEVIASCGKHVGVVDHVEGSSVKLTKSEIAGGFAVDWQPDAEGSTVKVTESKPTAPGEHHFIPLDWIESVDQQVHLNKNSEDVFRDWKVESAVCCTV